MTKEEPKKEAPVKKYRVAGVTASIWKNTSEAKNKDEHDRVFYNTTFEKAYKDQTTGDWKESKSYSFQDLSALLLVATAAQAWIAFESRQE